MNPLGVGATVDVKDRPLTTGGGINGPQGGASQRKVYDRNYYVTKMKEKMMVKMKLFRVYKKRLQNLKESLNKLARNSNFIINTKVDLKN